MNYNYEVTAPVFKTLTYQPSVRFDYQPASKLRFTGKFNGQNNAAGRPLTPGSLPGFNDTQRIKGTEWTSTWAASANYTIYADDVSRGDLWHARETTARRC